MENVEKLIEEVADLKAAVKAGEDAISKLRESLSRANMEAHSARESAERWRHYFEQLLSKFPIQKP